MSVTTGGAAYGVIGIIYVGAFQEAPRTHDAARLRSGVALVQVNTTSLPRGSSFVQSDLDMKEGHVRPTPDPNPVLLGGNPFDKQKYSDAMAAGGVDGLDLSDRPFYPQIYYDGAYHPICGIDFNDEAATTACRDIDRVTEVKPDGGLWMEQERFTYGGRVVKTNILLEQDAMPVGACLKGETLDSCTAGSNAFGDFTALDGRCMKGNPVGVQIVCQRRCRKFEERVFKEEYLEMAPHQTAEPFGMLQACQPFLNHTTTYYFADKTWMIDIDQLPIQPIVAFAELLINVMNEQCAENVIELICHSVFKECREVETDDPLMGVVASVMLPSLICKQECERHKAKWGECVAKIQQVPEDKELFDSNMATMPRIMNQFYHDFLGGGELPNGPDGPFSPFDLFDCDVKAGGALNEIPDEEVAASWILGRIPQAHFDLSTFFLKFGEIGWAFPRFMTSEMLYPEISSTYTGPDGVSYEVPCTMPGQAGSIAFETTCPDVFVKPILPDTNRGCIHACPIRQFTMEEYTTMWIVFIGIGICSFILNVFVMITWYLSGRREFEGLPFQLKACIVFGVLYGFVETIPSAILKFDLPCTNETVEQVGNSWLCWVNRSGQYLLLGIMVNLCALTISIYRALVNSAHHESNVGVNVLTTTIPFLFMAIAYGFDTDEEGTENYNLNAARHAFTCSMRFSTMVREWLVLWLPFCVSGILTAVFAIGCWWKIGDIQQSLGLSRPGASQMQSEGQKALEGQRRRLIRIAAMVSACLLLNVGTALSVTAQQSDWTEYEDKMFYCLTQSTKISLNWFNENEVKHICVVQPDNHPCNRHAKSFQEHSQKLFPLEVAPSFTPSCIWNPVASTSSLVCSHDQLLEHYPAGHPVYDAGLGFPFNWLEQNKICECSCDDLLPHVVKPSTFEMTLSFAAQSMVAAIVALNLGFREANLLLWKKFIKKSLNALLRTSSQVEPTADNSNVRH